MQLHTFQPVHRSKAPKRIARGGKRGGYSGRGIKGQKSRAGAKIRPALRDIVKKIPKQRGRSKHQFKAQSPKPAVLNVDVLARHFPAGATVTPDALVRAGAVARVRGRIPAVKILGGGELDVPLAVKGCAASTVARTKIEAAGGRVG